jgi:peptidoglycan/LPS O-acetylase OafA/YrhL
MSVYMNDVNGLRGIASLWILFYHCFLYSKLQWNFQGSTLMPLFFLLSGFSLTIGYINKFDDEKNNSNNAAASSIELGKKVDAVVATTGPEVLGGNENNSSSIKKKDFELIPVLKKFYYNRFIRAMPVYYITLCVAIPVTLAGYNVILNPEKSQEVISGILCSLSATKHVVGCSWLSCEWSRMVYYNSLVFLVNIPFLTTLL